MVNKEKYIKRIVDEELKLKLEVFGAINIVGPKWCGKTTTAEQFCKSEIKFQKNVDKENLIKLSKISPLTILEGEKPRLIDEWQDAPSIFDAVRSYCDETDKLGNFILTGSTSKKVRTYHSGTGRISKLRMYPMSLYESKESNGAVSLFDLFNNKIKEKGFHSELSFKDLIFATCRGGWPKSLLLSNNKLKLLIPKDYYRQI